MYPNCGWQKRYSTSRCQNSKRSSLAPAYPPCMRMDVVFASDSCTVATACFRASCKMRKSLCLLISSRVRRLHLSSWSSLRYINRPVPLELLKRSSIPACGAHTELRPFHCELFQQITKSLKISRLHRPLLSVTHFFSHKLVGHHEKHFTEPLTAGLRGSR